jgi:hypothetical protein
MMSTMTMQHTFNHFLRIALLTAVACAPAGCDRSGPTAGGPAAVSPANPAGAEEATTAEAPTPGGPQLTFTTLVHDFGRISDIDKQPCRFPFTNTGDQPLVISEIKATCGCTATSLDQRRFEPGEGSALEVVYTPGGQGRQDKLIRIFSNDPSQEVTELTVSAEVWPFVILDPPELQFGTVELGREYSATFAVYCRDPNMVIQSVGAGGQAFTARVLSEELVAGPAPEEAAPGPQQVQVTLRDTAPWGSAHTTVTIRCRGRYDEGGEEIERIMRLVAGATVFGEIHADRTFFSIPTVAPGCPFESAIRLTRPSGEPFEIGSAEVSRSSQPGVAVRAEAIAEPGVSGYDVIVSGQAGDEPGRFRGQVVITTDVPGEERLNLRFSGLVSETTE